MRLYFCGCCGHAIAGPHASLTVVKVPIDAGALAEWQAEVRRECQHVPVCVGPWQHAVRVVREEWARGEKEATDRRGH